MVVVIVVAGRAMAFLIGLFAWQGLVYASAPLMSLLNTRTQLSPELERRRRTESMRERVTQALPYLLGAVATVVVVVAVAALIGVGGSHPGTSSTNPFTVQHVGPGGGQPGPGLSPTPTVTVTPSTVISSGTPSPTVSPTPTVTSSPSPTSSASVAP